MAKGNDSPEPTASVPAEPVPPNRPHVDASRDETITRMWAEEKTLDEIGQALGVTKQSIMRWARAMRARGIELPERGPDWISPQRVARRNLHRARNQEVRKLLTVPAAERPTYQEVADRFGITRQAVSSLMAKERKKGRVRSQKQRWTPRGDDRLRKGLSKGAVAVARRMGRTIRAVQARATFLGLVWPRAR